jgi:hypothetical protein
MNHKIHDIGAARRARAHTTTRRPHQTVRERRSLPKNYARLTICERVGELGVEVGPCEDERRVASRPETGGHKNGHHTKGCGGIFHFHRYCLVLAGAKQSAWQPDER